MMLIFRLAFKTTLFLQHPSIKWYNFFAREVLPFHTAHGSSYGLLSEWSAAWRSSSAPQHMGFLMLDPVVCIVDHTSLCVSLKDKVKCVEVTCGYWQLHLHNLWALCRAKEHIARLRHPACYIICFTNWCAHFKISTPTSVTFPGNANETRDHGNQLFYLLPS